MPTVIPAGIPHSQAMSVSKYQDQYWLPVPLDSRDGGQIGGRGSGGIVKSCILIAMNPAV